MKVLHVRKTSGLAGAERHLIDLLVGLRARGKTVRLCLLGTGEYMRLVHRARSEDIDVATYPSGPHVNPMALRSVLSEVRSFKPDLVHTHQIHGDIYGQLAARIRGVATVSTMHTSRPFYRNAVVRTAARAVGRAARLTICISEHVKRFALELGLAPADRVRVVHYGIDSSRWDVTPEERRRIKADLALDGRLTLGIASRLIRGKGHDWLFDAVSRSGHDIVVLVAGDGPLRGELERYASSVLPRERVRFLGFVPDMRRFFGACDVLAFPTMPVLGEGFGLAALEAMASGVPVLASRCASLPEIVAHGETGFLVDPGNVPEMCDRLRQLATDAPRRMQMGESARRRAASEFDLERMLDRTVALYEEALR